MVTLKGAAINYCHYTHESHTRGGDSHTLGVGVSHTQHLTLLEWEASVIKPPLTDDVKGEREKLEPSASVELVLEFNPVQAQSVQEG